MCEKYPIGEVAKILSMTPRTIRFYDQKNLVKPEFVGDNGYRYYGEKQIQRLELINYLRQLDFSIKQIRQLLNDESGSDSLQLLFQNQIKENESKIDALKLQQKQLRRLSNTIATQKINVNNLVDIAQIMEKESKLTNLRKRMWLFSAGILLIEIIGLFSAYQFHRFDNLAAMMASIVIMLILVVGITSFLTKYYYDQVKYVCPNCGMKFIPSLRIFIFSSHTPKFRKLECPNCHHKAYCLEIAR